MNEDILKRYGIRYAEALYRCSDNKDLYAKLLAHFANNSAMYNNIVSYYEAKDYKNLANIVHEVKGISGNLGIESLCSISSAIMNLFYQNIYTIDELYLSLIAEYDKAILGIKEAMNCE